MSDSVEHPRHLELTSLMTPMDDDGKPIEVTPFVPETDDEVRRWNQAEQRRAARRRS